MIQGIFISDSSKNMIDNDIVPSKNNKYFRMENDIEFIVLLKTKNCVFPQIKCGPSYSIFRPFNIDAAIDDINNNKTKFGQHVYKYESLLRHLKENPNHFIGVAL